MAARRRSTPDRVREGRVNLDIAPRYLLDTVAVVRWSMDAIPRRSKAYQAIDRPTFPCFVSAVSVYEIVAKHASGKLPEAEGFVANMRAYLDEQDFLTLGISAKHAEVAGRLGGHRDPFDRLLAAQAITDGLVIVSPDAVFEGWGVKRVW